MGRLDGGQPQEPGKSAEIPKQTSQAKSENTPLSEGMSTKDQNLLGGRGFSAKIGLQ